MSLVTLRPKGQLTIPVDILQQWDIKPYEQLEISFQNGVITLVPAKRKEPRKKNRLMSFAGIGQGCWGETADDVRNTVHQLRDSWSR